MSFLCCSVQTQPPLWVHDAFRFSRLCLKVTHTHTPQYPILLCQSDYNSIKTRQSGCVTAADTASIQDGM